MALSSFIAAFSLIIFAEGRSLPQPPPSGVASLFEQSLLRAFADAKSSRGDWFRNLRLLGEDNFVDDFMSIEDPREGSDAGNLISEEADSRQGGRIAAQIEEIFSRDKNLASSRIGPKMKKKLTKLLASKTQCPVIYEWKDLGVQYWPRYIRVGSCSRKKSCSFPAGMGCEPAEESHLTLLRRFCGSRRWGKAEVEAFNPDSNCRWITMNYPIVTKCSCSC